jgi:hypothetical protein
VASKKTTSQDFLAPQRATYRVRSELPFLREGWPFFNDFAEENMLRLG